ncbi:dihydropteroate synthase [Campylobacter fetus]|uniref:dihydropteroate synthase n=1 Tax=Campylobacter fetus TaxID=196 RepID=A0A5L8W1K1_CAMFE|nr:dihydropteroate synthase [Campylobacter fetus]EAI4414100.1 dihydropteroate synthase [Campylobacter fetus]EAI5407145.1 dihydropteroate synthase [Campylobacter fetus]EAJ0326978.1 dihydropteroate synthase [Campylobacter fetus]EAJ1229567.1 dihydropteroate synthase [Campylobacter fetus]EAK0415308.1 dihydropteroate synthase [Campylobacter fetus]
MRVFKIDANSGFESICYTIKPQKAGLNIMKQKSHLNFFYIKDIKRAAANILKQDALSIGAELVSSKETVLGGDELENALLIANDKQISYLAKKELMQDFGLKTLAKFISKEFRKPDNPLIMGVLNFNEDSFNPSSRTNIHEAVFKIEKMINDGASYVDIGMVSSRPGSQYIGSEHEFNRVKPVIDEIYSNKLHEKVKLSLDSFDEKCLRYALERGFSMINDISADCSLATLAKEFGASYCLMHKKGDPQTMQQNVCDCEILSEVDDFFSKKLEILESLGAKDIYLDVGIGFGKTPRDNMILIKHLEHFLHFGYPLFVGASRKSVIDFYSKSSVEQRLAGTLFLHLNAFYNGASIVRVHDVGEHAQMFKLALAYRDLDIEG